MTTVVKFGTAVSGAKATKVVSLDYTDTGNNNLGSALPAGATVTNIDVNVTQAFDGTGNALKVGDSGDDDRLVLTTENDLEAALLYTVFRHYTYVASTQVVVNIANTGGSQGQVDIVLEYVSA